MKKHYLILSLLFSGFTASASPIVADYRCEEHGGGVAIKFPQNGSPARIWQTDQGSNEGLELKLIYFTSHDASNFAFNALLEKQLRVRGVVSNGRLQYSAYDSETGQWQIALKSVLCVHQ